MTKSKLNAEQQADAGRLKALFQQKAGKTQYKFGEEFGIGGGQSMIWQYLNAQRSLNLETALRFTKGLGCALSDISPSLAERLLDASPDSGALKSDERKLLRQYRDSSPSWRTAIQNFAALHVKEQGKVLDELLPTLFQSAVPEDKGKSVV